nr:hypothetical protein [Tanacetum cinerariifolium]
MSIMANTTPIVTTVTKPVTNSRDASNGERPENKECFRGIRESYDNSHSSYGTGINHRYRYPDIDRSRHMKRGKDSESSLSSVSKSDSSDGRHRKSKSKRHKPMDKDDLMMPWMCEEVDPFTPRIRNLKSLRKTRMLNNVMTYDGTGDREDHIKIFQAAAQVERWAMPTWCHMFNSTLIGAARVWFDELPPKSIDSYKDLKAAFLAYFMQQKKYVKDTVEIHNIKQKDGETIEDFMERFKVETGRMKGAPECMRIFGFMHGVNNPELTKRLNEHVPKTMEEMMITITAFIRGEDVATSKKKGHASWRTQDQSKRKTSEKRSTFDVSQGKEGSLAGHSTDECMQLKKHIEELVRAGKLSHLIKEIKHGRDQSKVGKKETPAKDKPMWAEGPLVIEAEIGRHMIHRMYVDGGFSTKVLYEHCFNRLRPEVKNKMLPATTSLTDFSGETIWPLGQLRLFVTIGDADHSTKAWMNFMIVSRGGIVTIRSTTLIPVECITVIILPKEIPKEAGVHHENFKVALHSNFPDWEVAFRGTLSVKGRTKLCSLLKENLDISAQYSGGIFTRLAKEKGPGLGTRQGHLSRGAKISRGMDYERGLLPRLVVQSSHGKKARQQLANLAESDEEKTAFHTGQGVYCYTKMPFGLKNAGATYQRLVDKAFDSQIGRNIEVYVDNLVIKSHTEAEMLRDIGETFRRLVGCEDGQLYQKMLHAEKMIPKENIPWGCDDKKKHGKRSVISSDVSEACDGDVMEALIALIESGLVVRTDTKSNMSNNNINILHQLPLFNDLKTGRAPEIPFVANGVTYPWGYYLVDGIYLELVTLVKTIPEPSDDDHKQIRYMQIQELARKDVERAFGVLKKKWAILANPARPLKKERIMNMMYTCIILHNMIRI